MNARERYFAWANRFALRLRKARFRLFEALLSGFGGERVRILDVGGHEDFWLNMGIDLSKHHVTVLNLPSELRRAAHPGITTVVGDACDLGQYSRGDFDVVFSNSVIEHVGLWRDQQRMAAEVRRLSETYFVQTPNFWFPFEPHAHVPGFQFLPLGVRTRLLQRFSLGHFPRLPDEADARKLAAETRLLERSELSQLFPDAEIEEEPLFGMTKSLMAVKRRQATSEVIHLFHHVAKGEASRPRETLGPVEDEAAAG